MYLDGPGQRVLARKAAILLAKGKSLKETAEVLEISVERVKTLKRSPLFQEMVSMIEEQVTKSGIEDVIKEMADDAPNTLRFMRACRDGEFSGEDAAMLSQRRAAAQWLGDRQLPVAKENLDRAVTVVIGGKLLNQIGRAMKNDGVVVEAEFESAEVQYPTTIEDMRAREAAAEGEEDDDE